MDAVALWVAGLPGAVGRISAFGSGPLLLGTAGLLLLCLLRTPLRWSGGIAVVVASLWALATPLPDILIASDGRVVAARGGDGRLAVIKTGNDSFAVREWLAADGDARTAGDASLTEGSRCDAAGCVARLADGGFVALSLRRTADGFAVTPTRPPGYDRPWARAVPSAAAAEAGVRRARPAARDATPRAEDLEPGD